MTFPRFFVFQRAVFMLPIFPSAEWPASPARTVSAICNRASSADAFGCKTLRCTRRPWPSSPRRREAPAMHALILEAVEPAFGRRIVPTVSPATHRTRHAVFSEFVLKRMAGVLAAPVGVVQHARRWLSPEPRHRQCVYVSPTKASFFQSSVSSRRASSTRAMACWSVKNPDSVIAAAATSSVQPWWRASASHWRHGRFNCAK